MAKIIGAKLVSIAATAKPTNQVLLKFDNGTVILITGHDSLKIHEYENMQVSDTIVDKETETVYYEKFEDFLATFTD